MYSVAGKTKYNCNASGGRNEVAEQLIALLIRLPDVVVGCYLIPLFVSSIFLLFDFCQLPSELTERKSTKPVTCSKVS